MKEFSFKQFIYIILILIFIYVGFETLLRWTLPKLFGFVVELNELANIKNIENYNEYYSSNYKKYLNPIIGFNRDYTDIELTDELFDKITKITYDCKDNTCGPKSISKQELIKEFNMIF